MMKDTIMSAGRIPRALLTAGVLLLALSCLLAVPAAARTDIRHIQNGDMIFVYEQNLDITALRTGGNPVTSLRKYQDDDPTKALLFEVPVSDDTSFSLIPEAFGNRLGVYLAYPAVGAPGRVVVQVPDVSIDAVLANPYHSDSISGLTIPEDTAIAFKIVSVDIGSTYHAGSLYPATVDLVLTAPGGAQLTTIEGRDFSRMNVSSQVFYTDDPGRPGAISLGGLGTGTFTVQARWRDPASFDMQAPDSNTLSFAIGRTTTTPTTTRPVTTPVTTRTVTPSSATTPPTPSPATTTTTPPATPPQTPPATATPSPSPTSTPTGAWIAFISPVIALIPRIIRKDNK